MLDVLCLDPSRRKSFKRDERASQMEDHTGPSVALACGPKVYLAGRGGELQCVLGILRKNLLNGSI